MSNKNIKLTSLSLSEETLAKIDRYARERDISRSAAIRVLINEHCTPLTGEEIENIMETEVEENGREKTQ